MNVVPRLTLCAMLLIAFPSLGWGGIEEEIEQMERNRYDAIMAQDQAALEAILGQEFFYNRNLGDSVPRAEFLKYVKADVELKKVEFEGTKVMPYGDVVLVTGITHEDLAYKGKDMTVHLRFLHVWVKRDGRWQLVARHATNVPVDKT